MSLPITSLSLLSRLRDEGDHAGWQVSWKRFLELYHGPLMAMAAGIYRYHTGNAVPPQATIEDVVATVVVDFFKRDRFDPERGRLRTYLRVLTNARVVDMLRKEKPLDHESITAGGDALAASLPAESPEEERSFQQALLATLIEDLREHIPLRQFEIFEMVKLKGTSPDAAAADLGVHRGVIDNTIYKVMTRLREIASTPEYQEEYEQSSF
jgi:RNA polymerase sigma factor (sigma-70 family)